MFWWILPLLVVAAIFKSAWFKGHFGEVLVNVSASLLLDKNNYHLIKNVTIPAWGGSSRIDHIIVSRFGIFVVETKNMKGWIFGDVNQKSWTQQLLKTSHAFQNPPHKNQKHTKTIEIVLGLEPEKLFSVVVFIGGGKFKTAMPENVTYSGGYIRHIKSKTQVLLTDQEVQEAIRQFSDGRLKPSIKTHSQHVKHVRSSMAAMSEPAPSSRQQVMTEVQQ